MTSIVPVFQKLGPALTSIVPVFHNLSPALTSIVPVFQNLCPALTSIVPVFHNLGPALTSIGPVYHNVGPMLPTAITIIPGMLKISETRTLPAKFVGLQVASLQTDDGHRELQMDHTWTKHFAVRGAFLF